MNTDFGHRQHLSVAKFRAARFSCGTGGYDDNERLPMRRIREILQLKYEQQLSQRAIVDACRVGLGTVSEHLRRSRRAGLDSPTITATKS